MRELLANVAVIAATATTFTFLLPQIFKLVRTRDSSGVSTTWPAMGFVSNIGWFGYFVHEALWASIVAPLGASIGYAVTLWALARTGRPLNRSAMRGILLGALLICTTAIAGWTTLGVALGLTFAVMMIPTLTAAFATPDPSGISPGTWWIGMLEAALWGFYGWHHADAGILTFSATAAIGSGLMLGRYHATR
jgi:uncharacterized protein with PQ loop repeat